MRLLAEGLGFPEGVFFPITTVDFNPNLSSENPNRRHVIQNAADFLLGSADDAYGLVIAFGIDGSLEYADMPFLLDQLHRVVRKGGAVLFFPLMFYVSVSNLLKNNPSKWKIIYSDWLYIISPIK